MKPKTKLSTSWYATQLKDFAETIGIPSARALQKDELERAIKFYLGTGRIRIPTKRNLSPSGVKDVNRGLSLNLPVVVYTNDKETKRFLEQEARKLAPGLKRKSGVRLRSQRLSIVGEVPLVAPEETMIGC